MNRVRGYCGRNGFAGLRNGYGGAGKLDSLALTLLGLLMARRMMVVVVWDGERLLTCLRGECEKVE